jgi:ABC-type glutathione transport system ATPase component
MATGEAWAIVGESGAGKSTLLNLVLGLLEPTEGQIQLEGATWSPLPERDRRSRRSRMQAVFQDPLASLPPHLTGWEILEEPWVVHRRGHAAARREAAARMARRVKCPEAALSQRPDAWSSGIAQRVCLGRALMLEPALLVLDEPFSALDPTLGSHLLSLLLGLKAEGLALLFVSHDLTLARRFCDQLLVLHKGAPVCRGPFEQLVSNPHPHLHSLIEAMPELGEA